jgi:hypothetical protein
MCSPILFNVFLRLQIDITTVPVSNPISAFCLLPRNFFTPRSLSNIVLRPFHTAWERVFIKCISTCTLLLLSSPVAVYTCRQFQQSLCQNIGHQICFYNSLKILVIPTVERRDIFGGEKDQMPITLSGSKKNWHFYANTHFTTNFIFSAF